MRPNDQAAISAHVDGLREAKAAFSALPEITRDAMLVATEVTVREIARGAQQRLLASPSVQTRNLYNAIGWTINKNTGLGRAGVMNVTTSLSIGGKKVRVKGIVTAGAGGSASKSAGASLDKPRRRAHFVEFGTRFMPAEPFMTPSAAAEKQPYLDRCRAAGKTIETDMAAIGMRHL